MTWDWAKVVDGIRMRELEDGGFLNGWSKVIDAVDAMNSANG
jgi:hypothetical protein